MLPRYLTKTQTGKSFNDMVSPTQNHLEQSYFTFQPATQYRDDLNQASINLREIWIQPEVIAEVLGRAPIEQITRKT